MDSSARFSSVMSEFLTAETTVRLNTMYLKTVPLPNINSFFGTDDVLCFLAGTNHILECFSGAERVKSFCAFTMYSSIVKEPL